MQNTTIYTSGDDGVVREMFWLLLAGEILNMSVHLANSAQGLIVEALKRSVECVEGDPSELPTK